MRSYCLLILLAIANLTAGIVAPPKQLKLFIHGDTLYKLEITQEGAEKFVRVSTLFKIPKRQNVEIVKPVTEPSVEDLEVGDQNHYEDNKKFAWNQKSPSWHRHLIPPDPILQIRLSHFGKYQPYPNFYGLSNRYGLYSYSAGNDVNNNLPRGQYKYEVDIDNR